MNGGMLIGAMALLIPLVAVITDGLRRMQAAEVQRAQRDVELRRRFRTFDEIERRVADMERYVTSPEFHLNREIGALARKP